MPDFNIRSDSVNVEQIMEQIRARIREKRGVDYTEQQIRELAAVKLEKFLDPRGIRSDLLDQFKRHQPRYEAPIVPSFTFEDTTMFETHRGLLRFIRGLLNPILKLFFNPNAIIHALHTQAEVNRVNLEREVTRENQRRDVDALYYEVIHNLVFEVTRLGIEVKNLTMRVESLTGRLEFNERRARALESVVAYKPSAEPRPEPVAAPAPQASPRAGQPVREGQAPSTGAGQAQAAGTVPEGPGQRSRRRRRRRGRRGGPPAVALMAGPSTGAGQAPSTSAAQAPSTGAGQAPSAGSSQGGASSGGDVGPGDRAAEEAAREATGAHDETAESVERALAAEAHPTEPHAGGGPTGGPDGPGTDQQ